MKHNAADRIDAVDALSSPRSHGTRSELMALNDLIGVLNQYRGASASNPPATVERDYSEVASQAPQADLASGLATAFRSDQTPPFGQMLGSLFSKSNGQQRAGILNQLLGAVGPSLLTSGARS